MSKDQKRLDEIEAQILSGIDSVGSGLLEINKKRLYLLKHETFEDYCRQEWGFSKSRAHQLIEACEVRQSLSTIVDTPPTKESHLREIAKVPKNKQAKVAAEVLEKCEAEQREPTAKDYRAAAKPHVKKSTKVESTQVEKPEFDPTESELEINKLITALIKNGCTSTLEAVRDRLLSVVPVEQTEVSTYEGSFQDFWDSYPPTRKRDKAKAKKVWDRKLKDGTDPNVIISAALEFSQSPEGISEYCPGPEPWLNGERWDDDREAWNRGENGKPVTFAQQKMNNTAQAVRAFQQKMQAKENNAVPRIS